MKTKLIIGILSLMVVNIGNSQIVTSTESLPEVGDVLQYKNIDNVNDSYDISGTGVLWDFNYISGEIVTDEGYLASDQGANFDQFPDTDILLTLAGAEAYANRNTTNIEVVGIAGGQLLEGLELAEAQFLSEPYVIRRAPLGYSDTFSGSSSFSFKADLASFGPLADLINEANPIEGATIDSVGVNITLSRSEEVDSYGVVLLGGQTIESLRLVQTDQTDVGIEVYVTTFLGSSWIDVSAFVDLSEFGFDDQVTTNYIFLDENSKEYLVEINETLGGEVVTGRYNADFTNSLTELDNSVVKTYPNPVYDQLFIENYKFNNVQLTNTFGQVVLSETLSKTGVNTLDLSHLASGAYVLHLSGENGLIETKKIIKK